MKLTVIECRVDCKRTTIVGAADFKYGDTNGVYVCPICKGKNVNILVGPFEIEPPKIKIKGGNLSEKLKIAATLAKFAGQGKVITRVEQLHSPGRGDDEPGEGTLQKLEEPIVDDGMVIRPKSSCSDYEIEVSKYLGVPPKFDI